MHHIVSRKALFAIWLLALSFAAWGAGKDEKGPGGQGRIESAFWNECFKSDRGVVVEVCAKHTVTWKMWGLMGEPMGDYRVAWNLLSIKLMDPQRKTPVTYGGLAGALPAGLQKAAAKLELYVDGYASVVGPGVAGAAYHRFNTGVAVRAGKGSSMNMTGGYDWDKVFMTGGDMCGDKNVLYMAPAQAKQVFSRRFDLMDLKMCPQAQVYNISDLEAAADALCAPEGADKTYAFCPRQEKKKEKPANTIGDAFAKLEEGRGGKAGGGGAKAGSGNAIDDAFASLDKGRSAATGTVSMDQAFEQAEVERQRRVEYARKMDAARGYCIAAKAKQDSCAATTCGNKPDEQICKRREEIADHSPCKCSPAPCGCLRLPSFGKCIAYDTNPKFTEWNACVARKTEECMATLATRITTVEQCVADRMKTTEKSAEKR